MLKISFGCLGYLGIGLKKLRAVQIAISTLGRTALAFMIWVDSGRFFLANAILEKLAPKELVKQVVSPIPYPKGF